MSKSRISALRRLGHRFVCAYGAPIRGITTHALLLLAATLFGSFWSTEARAVSGCELVASGAASISGQSGESKTLFFRIEDRGGCSGANLPDISVSIVPPNSQGATLLTSNSIADAATGTNFPVTIQLGDTDGTAAVKIECGISQCNAGSPQYFSFSTDNIYTLEALSLLNLTARPGDNVSLAVVAKKNGAAFNTAVDFQVIGDPGPFATVTSVPPSGAATTWLAPTPVSSPGIYQIEASYCDFASSCDGTITSTFNVTVGPWQLTTFNGSAQSPYIYQRMDPLIIQLVDGTGVDPLVGKVVNFSTRGSAASGVTLSTSSATTDANGRVQVVATTGSVTGPLNIDAVLAVDSSVTYSASYSVTGISEPGISIVSGDSQQGNKNDTLAPLIIAASNNSGDPAINAPVTWSVLSGEAILQSASTTTNTAGQSSNGFKLGSTRDPVVVEAKFLGATQLFYASVNDSYELIATTPTTLTVGVGQSALLGTRYLFNEAPGTNASISWSSNGGSLANTLVTPDPIAGNADNTFSSSTPGVYTIFASVECNATVSQAASSDTGKPTEAFPECPPPAIAFTVTVASKALLGGGNVQGNPGKSFLLTVRAEDGGVPVSGRNIDWLGAGDVTLSAPSSLTDASGNAVVTATLGNSVGSTATVTARRSDNASATAAFSLAIVAPQLIAISGDNQTGVVGVTATNPLVVELRDGTTNNLPIAGDTITWSVISGPAQLASGTSITDANGRASVGFSFGATAGASVLRARDSTTLASATFSSTAVGLSLDITSGTGQTGTVGLALANPLVVRAARDGAPEPGILINWSTAGSTITLGSSQSSTDASGVANLTVTCAATGTFSVLAARNDLPSANQTFTGSCDADRTLLLHAGDGQSGYVGQSPANPLVVEARDNGTAAAGISVTWSVSSGDATVTPSSTTDTNGFAQATVTFGSTPGAVVVAAYRNDKPAATVEFALTSNALPPNQFTLVSGDGQTGVTSSAGDNPLTVNLKDGFGVPISSKAITWTVQSGNVVLASGTTMTNASGDASNTFFFGPTAGAATVRAAALSGSLTVDFTMTASAGTQAPASGNAQTGEVGKTLPAPLVVKIDGSGSPGSAGRHGNIKGLAGVPVTWVVTAGGGSVSASNTVTDPNGESSVFFTLGPNPGTHSVTASTPGGTTVFTATAFIPTGVLTKISGDNQTLPTNTDSAPLIVQLKDDAGRPLPGITIAWVADNATLDAESTVTDANGKAQVIASVTQSGAASVSASSANPSAAPVTFSLNGGVANLPNLDPVLEQVGAVIDNLCPALAGIANPTPQQQDLALRCRELLDAAGLDPDATVVALEELFEEMARAQADATLLALQAQFQNIKARLAALRSGNTGGGMGGAGFNGLTLSGPGGMVSLSTMFKTMVGEAPVEAETGFSRWGWFVSGNVGRGETDALGLGPAFDYDINGLTSGIDYRYRDNLVIGGSLGYTKQDTDSRDGTSSMETKGWSVSGYASWFSENNWYVDGVLTWGRNKYNGLRRIEYTLPLVGGGTIEIDQLARANSNGDLLQGAFTLGRDFQKGGWTLGAYGRVLYNRADIGDAQEVMLAGAGSGLGLFVEGRELTSLATVLGGKASYAYSASWGILMPYADIEWEHETQDDPGLLTAYFIHDPTQSPIIISSGTTDRDFFRLGFGLSMVMTGGKSGFLYYQRVAGRTGQSQDNLSLGFRMEF